MITFVCVYQPASVLVFNHQSQAATYTSPQVLNGQPVMAAPVFTKVGICSDVCTLLLSGMCTLM